MRVLLAALFMASSAHAALLEGQPVTIEHLYPTLPAVNEVLADRALVGDGPEAQTFDAIYSVDIADKSVTVTQLRSVNWALAPFNGLHIYAPGVTFFAASTRPFASDFQHWRIDDPGLSFDEHNLWLNFQGMSILAGEHLTIDINNPQPVPIPEPSTCMLLLAGIAALQTRRFFSGRSS